MERMEKCRLTRYLLIPVMVVLFTACATPPSAPTDKVAVAQAAVEDAQKAEGRTYAPIALQSAEEKLVAARAAVKQDEYERAQRLATEAEVDARLAEVSARSAKDQNAAQEVQESIQTLRQELNLPVN
jgi:outer membrane PBP1 activator LpoA protein